MVSGINEGAILDADIAAEVVPKAIEPDDQLVVLDPVHAGDVDDGAINARVKNIAAEFPSGVVLPATQRMKITDEAFFDRAFNFAEVDVRGYIPIRALSDRDVLAVRGVARLTDGTQHEAAPFCFLPRLGGGGLLRGYETSRFVDTQALFASAEYRWQAHRRLQIVSFVDIGGVAPAMRAFTVSNLQTSAGIGLRYRGFRVDYARGAEGGRFHVGVGMGF